MESTVPLVSMIIGRGWGRSAHVHLEPLFALIGLKVVMPFTPHDAKGCFVASKTTTR